MQGLKQVYLKGDHYNQKSNRSINKLEEKKNKYYIRKLQNRKSYCLEYNVHQPHHNVYRSLDQNNHYDSNKLLLPKLKQKQQYSRNNQNPYQLRTNNDKQYLGNIFNEYYKIRREEKMQNDMLVQQQQLKLKTDLEQEQKLKPYYQFNMRLVNSNRGNTITNRRILPSQIFIK